MTTHAVRSADASLSHLSLELGSNPKTVGSPKMVAKWRKRATVEDMKSGPKEPRSTILTAAAAIVTFRRHTLLLLDDCLYALQSFVPHLRWPALHLASGKAILRIVFSYPPQLQWPGISRLSEVDGDKPKRQQFKGYPIGYFLSDIAEVLTVEV